MDFTKFNWADAYVNKINIEYDCADILIGYEFFNSHYTIRCTGLAGLTNLCIWEDMEIAETQISRVNQHNSKFINSLFSVTSLLTDPVERSIKDGFFELKITLTNDTTFSVFCQRISVLSESGEEIETWTIEGNPEDYASKITTADGTKIMTEEIWKSL